MGKVLILLIIIAGAFWLGRLSAKAKNNKIADKPSGNEPEVIDIEIEDKSDTHK
ncbi:MAG: hypothetical protein AAF462_10085 [Thermodesulfobacteriota bacterium]